jgi:hypothetical protein
MSDVQCLVLSPLNLLLALFQGPQRLIQKRQHKCLDYDSCSNRIDKIKDRDKLKAVSSLMIGVKPFKIIIISIIINELCPSSSAASPYI